MGRFQFTSSRMLSAIAWFAIALALLMFRLRERQHYSFVGPFDLLGATAAAGGAIGALAGNAIRGALIGLACGLFFLVVVDCLLIAKRLS
jgi:hypothetical protein